MKIEITATAPKTAANDLGNIPIEVRICAALGRKHPSIDCPLLALNHTQDACIFHATGKLNAVDQIARKGITPNDILRSLINRRRAAVNYFACRKLEPTYQLTVDEWGEGFTSSYATSKVGIADMDETDEPSLFVHLRIVRALLEHERTDR